MRKMIRHDPGPFPSSPLSDALELRFPFLSVAECYDSAVSARPHREAFTPEEALQMIRGGSGTLFDPEVAQFFTAAVPSH